jgi:peptide/nickel transport system substrate-binding protein
VSARRGGTLEVFAHADFTSLDPGRARSKIDFETASATQRPLLSHKPNQFSVATPDLAAGPPSISPDGRTVTVRLKRGVHFSPPVDREATSGDVAYAIERGANPNVASPYFNGYFSSLEGASHARGGAIPGITTPDAHTIVFHLTSSSAATVVGALSLPMSAPVPAGFARRYDSEHPSRYGQYQVATGPYMLAANRRGRVLGIGYVPGRSARLVRNPSWRTDSDFRPAYVDEIRIAIGRDPADAARRTLTGAHAVQNDPPRAAVQLAYQRFRDQLQISPDAGIAYVAVNNRSGPLSNADVRRALWAAMDRVAMSRAVDRTPMARVATHFLYPGIPGFGYAEQSVSGRRLAYEQDPRGNLRTAERYMKHAGYVSGRYEGTHVLRVVAAHDRTSRRVTRIVDRALRALGFHTRLYLVNDVRRSCGIPSNEIDICPNDIRKAIIADGQALLSPAFNGAAIRSAGSENWGQVDNVDLNSAIKRESRAVEPASREQAWSDVDNGLVGLAVAIPYAWLNEAALESRDVAGVGELWNSGAWDFSFTSLERAVDRQIEPPRAAPKRSPR